MKSNTVLSKAKIFASNEWPVFPLHGKKPIIKDWPNQATTDIDQIDEWFGNGSPSNIGILTGSKSGIFILDVDKKNSGIESLNSLEKEHGPLPETLVAQTGGGGYHYYFNYPEGGIKNSTGKIGPGLDIRGQGGYVVAPPSCHENGNTYQWENEGPDNTPIADAPKWLLKLVEKPKNQEESKVAYHEKYYEGSRNSSLTSYAGKLKHKGLNQKEISILLLQENQEKCVPPLNKIEVLKIAESISKYPSKFPPDILAQSLSDFLKIKQEKDSKKIPGELLGYKLGRFNEIEDAINGLQQGLYIIMAETNIGKTTLALNISLEALIANKDLTLLYFSLDDNRDFIINRILAMNTGLTINELQYKQTDPKKRDKLSDCYKGLMKLADEDRLILKDIAEIQNIDQLESEVKCHSGKKVLVTIDGLYNLDIGKTYGGKREENIERANKVKALVDAYQIPIITTAEVRKKPNSGSQNKPPTLDDLMESGKFAYNANLVWILYRDSKDDSEGSTVSMLKLKYAKNKLSPFKDIQDLTFKKLQGRIEELSCNLNQGMEYDDE